MKISIGSLSGIVIAVALSIAPFAAGQTPMSFNGYYSAVSCIGPEGCVGAGLYGGTINGVNVGQGQNVPGMICDDYFDNITAGQTWKASGLDAANIGSNLSQTLFGAAIGLAGYTEVAYLANTMLTSAGLTSAQQGAISEAIWYITSKGASGALALGSLAQGYLTAALNAWNNGNGITLSQFANLYLYTPSPQGPGEAQEMWSLVPVPEGGTALAYLLLAGVFCFGAMRLRLRQQTSGGRSAV